ncbi:amino acid adenylation domain-containing protein [Pseudomonas mosselii]|uniref:non-ribosomal peptide synthetase n=2 Tax=Pseudomonas mosselii TaxID=78327 RepID=UPI0016467F2F|nr:amino acid adenylation domain-containing protein [Pseudomonas mosselii]
MQELLDSVKSLSTRERKALAALLKRQGVNLYGVTPIFRRESADGAALSYAQQRQWFLWQLDPHSAAYNIPAALRLKGALDIEALQRSFDSLVARHETLRTTFRQEGDGAVQIVHPSMPLALAVEPLAVADPASLEAAIRARVEAEVQQPFDLQQGPLLRVRLLVLGPEEHVLILTVHHIVSDGWSTPILVDELIRLYQGLRQGSPVTLAELPIQYADYALWQRDWMEAGEQERQLGYWRQQLAGEQPLLELPVDRPRPSVQNFHGARLAIDIDASLAQALKALARQQGVTLFMLLLASFQTLLHRYSGQADIRVGIPVANRARAETQGLIGFFVNTQVLKAEFAPQTTFTALLQQVREAALQAQAHQDLPFEQLVEALQPERSMSHNPLFQVLFNHQAESPGMARQLGELQVEGLSWEGQTTQFDLILNTAEHDGGLIAALTYATSLFDPATVERIGRHWRNLLQGICQDHAQRVAQLPLLDMAEQDEWKAEVQRYPSTLCAHELIEAQAARTPEAVAVTFAGQSLSYDQLNRRANRLAHKLREQGVGPDVLVGIAVERGFEMIVGLLAILKAGGAYVPLDPEYPQDRLSYMMEDSGIQLLLTQGHLLAALPVPAQVHSLKLEDDLAGYSEENPEHLTQPDNLAYVIYTSGSTGKPKGTLLPHHNLLRLFKATDAWFGFGPQDVWTLFHSYAFDFSVWEIFGALLHGGRLVIVPRETTRSPEDFHQLLVEQGVTVLNQTPSAFKPLMRVACDSASDLSLRYVIFGGEALDVAALQPWFERFGEDCDNLINMYGITETTVHVTYRPIRFADTQQPGSPIGAAIPDLSMYVLDADFNPVAKGCTGELHVGHAGLARGYHNRASLTAERFVPDPFSSEGGRLYRTGDLARYRGQEVIEYVGRIDHQVKIRGFRIELGEIEARLQEHAAVREVLVLDIDGAGGKQLVAYLIAQDENADHAALRDTLKQHLKANLPDYMVPTHFLVLEQWPLTANGKLDRNALPKPDASQLQQGYVAPRTALEQQLAAIWSEVLKVEQVGLHDNFFELGGHSLLATQVTSRIRQRLDLEVPLRSLFESADLLAFAQAASQGSASQAPAFTAVDRNQPLPLSYAQQRQWFLWQLEPESAAYNIPSALRLKGELNIEALRSSFAALIARHETLRTTFHQEGEQTWQRIHPASDFDLAVDAVSADALQARVAEEARQPFHLENGPLLRARLLRLAEDDHVLVLTLHHIVADGWSMPIMVDEVVRLYAGYCQGAAAPLPALAFQYADYAAWQRQWMAAGEQTRQLDYWRGQLGDEQPVLELPLDRPRPLLQSHVGERLDITLERELAEALKATAREQGVTLFMLLLASFQSLLHRVSGQTDIRVGVPIANRTRAETEGLIGFFVNTQVLKAEFDLRTTFGELLQQVKHTALQAQAHQDLPFEQLVEALQPERSLSHSPLFQVMFNHQTYRAGDARQLPGLTVEGLAWDNHTAQLDLSLDTFESDDGLGASLTYVTELFERATVERLAGYWLVLLRAIARQPQQAISDLALLDFEQQRQLASGSEQPADFSAAPCVHQLFEAQAAQAPQAVALVCEGEQLTYQALNRRANRIAHKLRALGVGPDVPVGIAIERGLDMVVSVLAVLKAGGAYVPLDPDYPHDRLAYMIQDSGLRLLLTQSGVLARLNVAPEVRNLCLDQGDDWLQGCVEDDLANLTQADNLAYIMYTSGSTGRPKGVGISAAALRGHVLGFVGRFGLTAADRALQFSTFNFDAFVEQLYPALVCGARVVLRGQALWDSETWYRQVLEQGVTFSDLPTAYWHMLAKDFAAHGPRDYGQLRRVHMGGEAMAADGVLAWRAAGLAGVRLVNTYGPTEATVCITSHDCSDYVTGQAALPGQIPIGQALPGRSVYLVDAAGNLALPGSIGELLVGGELLARGYHNRPGQSAERFIPDPFGASAGGRLYRTGDLARLRADGVIEFIGRVDHQVKIRGFRIELGEIDARLREHPGVREALVIDIDGAGGKQLAAYLVPSAQAGDDLRADLLRHLKAGLPEYMVPAHLVFLEAMPQTPNGKLDRKALPKPDASQAQADYVAPRSELEQRLAAIWAEVLKVEQVGLHDNFFELGGHSLLATQVIARVRQGLGLELALRSLFECPDLQGFAALAAQGSASLAPALLPVDRGQPLALSYAQQRQWFLWQLEPDSAAYHIPAALRLKGRLNLEALRQAFEALVARHESLRTTFHQEGGQALQRIHPASTFTLVMESLQDTRAEAVRERVAREVQRPFDLSQGPLLRVRLLRLAEDDHVLVLTLHHIVADGWSMPIMVDEVVDAYLALSQGQQPELPALAVQYADYAAWQRQWMEAGEQARQLDYWLAQLGGEHYVLQLPTDHPRPTVQSHAGRSLTLEVPAALAQALKAQAREQGVTLFMLLLASFQSLLHRQTGQADIRVGVPIANRTRAETEGLIGFFVNTQVLKAEFDLQTTFTELLQQVKHTALQAQAHQDLPFEQLVEALQPERSLSHNPLFQVMFNHQAYRAENVRELPGLSIAGLAWDNPTAHLDLALDTFESEDGLGATLTYVSDLFEHASIERMAGHWLNLLQAVSTQPAQRIVELPLLDAAQRQTLLEQWSRHEAVYPDQRTVQQLIADQSARTPRATALICEGQQLTYQALDQRANQLAHRLRQEGIGPDVRVGIALPRSLDMVVGLLAVLKAGGAYVPLDPDYPHERLAYMMEDSGIVLLLGHSAQLQDLAVAPQVRSLCLDSEALDAWPSHALPELGDPDNLAYIMYTSGSTGRPKGVGISAAALSRHAHVAKGFCGLSAADRVLQFSTFNFDAFVEQLYPALICGASVVVRGPTLWDSETFYREVLSQGITFADLPTAYWYLLAKDFAAKGPRDYGVLRQVHMGGEAMAADGVLAWQQAGLGHVRLLNTYGPTEATVSVMSHDCSAYVTGEQPLPVQIPIGKALAGRSIHLVDADGDLALPGAIGELLVGGELLARGYHNRPGLTAERFIPDPFATTPGARLYRTGDLARYREQGLVEYAGRIDHQVKIRGFRIELGEIEARLREHPAVREVLVVDIDGPGGKQLAAYLVPNAMPEEQGGLRAELKAHLGASLPDYMVPMYLVPLERMPLLPNGKLDRKALPAPDTRQAQSAYVAPVSELEQQLAALWAEVLEVERVGLNDDFFELGGHSLLAAQLISKINSGLGIDIPLRLLFEKPQLNDFAQACASTGLSLSEDGLSDIERMMNEMAGV